MQSSYVFRLIVLVVMVMALGFSSGCRKRKYENPIEFWESHKLWLDTNSKPTIRAADDQATFNRLHPIPFTVTIPAAEIDKSLPRKLLAEGEGILAWAVAGALQWRRNGLSKPVEVTAANDDWQSENDQLGRFIEDSCVVGDSFSGRARPLYMCYREWAEGAGETAITETMFGRRLKARGFTKVVRKYGAVYAGIALRAPESASEEKRATRQPVDRASEFAYRQACASFASTPAPSRSHSSSPS